MVAAVLSTDLLRLIPGSKVIFFEALHARTSVQYQLADKDKWCLLHANRWQHLKQAGAVLENILVSPPATVDDLTTKLDECSAETASEPEQVNALSILLSGLTCFIPIFTFIVLPLVFLLSGRGRSLVTSLYGYLCCFLPSLSVCQLCKP